MNDLYGWIYKPEWLQEELHWQFYTNDVANRVSIVYGKNGSGKTTFSDAINFYLGKPTKSSFINSTPIDLNSKEVTSIDKNRIFIFNENFINETIGFKEGSDSLNAIVMFGEAKNINDEIERITTENKTISKSIEPLSKELSQYRLWINDIFEYAQKNPDEIDDEISRQNEMRRVLEAYFTFNYGGGFEEKLSNEEILQKIDDEQLRSYFESSIFKIGVHSGSHSETFIKLDDDGPYGYFLDDCSNDEKIRLARDLICLLFSLDDLHIISMLSKNEGEEKQIKKTINEWIKQIQTNV